MRTSTPPYRRLSCLVSGFAAVVSLSVPLAGQELRDASPAPATVSTQRITKALKKNPAPRLKVNVPLPVATFRTTVEREYMLPFKEQLQKQFELTPFQRQSQEWASKGRGLNLLALAKGAKSAYRDYQARKIHEEVAQELAAMRELK